MIYDQKVKNRLRRIEGQIKGVLRMMEEEQDCKDIVTQLSASRAAIDRAIGVIVSNNLISCVQNKNISAENLSEEELVKEAVDLLVKSR